MDHVAQQQRTDQLVERADAALYESQTGWARPGLFSGSGLSAGPPTRSTGCTPSLSTVDGWSMLRNAGRAQPGVRR